MEKVLYYQVPSRIKHFHSSIKGMRLFKGIWGNFNLESYITAINPRLIIMNEENLIINNMLLENITKETKIVVLSNNLNNLERADAIINENNELITKHFSCSLEDKAQKLYLWALGSQILTKCIKCSYLKTGTHYECEACGSCLVEVAKSENHV